MILYGFYETDVMLLRLWTVSGLICYSVVPNAWRGNVLLAAWGSLFVGLNAYRLVELASERVPVWLDDDEWACYEASGLNRFVAPSCFKRLAAQGQFVDEPAGRVLKEENDPCPNFLVVRSGTVLLSAHGRPLGGGVLGRGPRGHPGFSGSEAARRLNSGGRPAATHGLVVGDARQGAGGRQGRPRPGDGPRRTSGGRSTPRRTPRSRPSSSST